MKTSFFNVLLVMGSAVLLLVSCNPKEQAYNDLQEFTRQLEVNNKDYTPEQWEQSLMQYDELCQSIAEYETEYTTAEIENIGRLKGKCQAIFTRHALEDGVDDFKRLYYEYKGLFEGLLEGINGLLEGY